MSSTSTITTPSSDTTAVPPPSVPAVPSVEESFRSLYPSYSTHSFSRLLESDAYGYGATGTMEMDISKGEPLLRAERVVGLG